MTEEEGLEEHAPDLEQMSFRAMVRRFFYMSRAEREQERRIRLYRLNALIEVEPDAAVHYLLRADIHAEMKQHEQAEADYRRAAELADKDLKTARFGLAAQAIRDKALNALRRYGG